jgi:hypothetical protein
MAVSKKKNMVMPLKAIPQEEFQKMFPTVG